MAFGKRKVPFGSETEAPPVAPAWLPVDSDGKQRVFGEAVFERFGPWLNEMGFHKDSARNLVPDKAEYARRLKRSAQIQSERWRDTAAALVARHGSGAIKPFFLFEEQIFHSETGDWLVRVLDLYPYDRWNVTYLPTDATTARALGLPLHPDITIPVIADAILEKLAPFRTLLEGERIRTRQELAQKADMEALRAFSELQDRIRGAVLELAAKWTAEIIELIADQQRADAA